MFTFTKPRPTTNNTSPNGLTRTIFPIINHAKCIDRTGYCQVTAVELQYLSERELNIFRSINFEYQFCCLRNIHILCLCLIHTSYSYKITTEKVGRPFNVIHILKQFPILGLKYKYQMNFARLELILTNNFCSLILMLMILTELSLLHRIPILDACLTAQHG